MGARRQAEDKDIEKTLFLKAEQRKRTDIESGEPF